MDIEQARRNMIEQQIRPWNVLDHQVLHLLDTTPRELFVPDQYKSLAFSDMEVPLGHGQAMMAPKIEGRLLQALQVQPTDSVLEIGTGSGFMTACLAKLAKHVNTVEYYPEFVERAQDKLNHIGLLNVTHYTGDASRGWCKSEPYDVVAVTASLPDYHNGFEQLLKTNGRLFVVVGEQPAMQAMLITRTDQDQFIRTSLFETALAPLINSSKQEVFVL